MKFLVIKNGDNDKLAAILVQDSKGEIGYATVADWYKQVLAVLLQRGRFFEEKHEDHHVYREQVKKEDSRFFDILRHKISPPMVPIFWGEITGRLMFRVEDALNVLWPKFTPDPIGEIKKVV